jgi:hypothetical protein
MENEKYKCLGVMDERENPVPYLLGYGVILATLEGSSMVDKVLQVV